VREVLFLFIQRARGEAKLGTKAFGSGGGLCLLSVVLAWLFDIR
jgi:hypothetical protein